MYPYPNGDAYPRIKPKSKKLVLFILFILLAILSFAGTGGGGVLTFKNATLESGTDKQDGAIYRFSRVESDFDALVKIKEAETKIAV
jgi:hypothetical protein